MKAITDEKKIEEILGRGVENIYPSKEELEKVLLSGRVLSIYNGIDPTGPTLHIGHGSTLLKLKEFSYKTINSNYASSKTKRKIHKFHC